MGGAFLARALRGPRPYAPPPFEPPPRRARPAKGPSLLLVTLDTTRADRLGSFGNDLVETPRLDAFAASGVRFENAFCPMPETDPSHASIMTGLEPVRHGVMKNGWRLPPERTTLAEILRGAGYSTYGAVSVEHLGRKTGFDQGFDVFDGEFDGHQRDGGDTLKLVRTWLDDVASRPFFLWVHWFDAHRDNRKKSPRYLPPAPFLPDAATEARYASRSLPAEVARYDAQIRYLDRLFGALLDEIERRGALRNTVVAVIADHGETLHELVERFGYGYTHGDYLYDHQVRVPFLLAGPGIPSGRRVPSQVRVFDLLPTVLAALGLEAEVPEGLDGANLLPLARGEGAPDLPVFLRADLRSKHRNTHDAALREGARKLILTKEVGPEFFELGSDPHEMRNLLAEGPEPPEAAPMRERLLAWLARAATVEEQEIDPRLREALHDLGYLGGDREKPR
jgi:arylsulfatase A-like enzyme